jgi:hypothetical protein
MNAALIWSWLRQIPKPKVPAFCHPFRHYQQAVLTRVGQVISNRLDVIQSDWEDDLEDGAKDPKTIDLKHRSRAREVNAILCGLQREFPQFDFPEGTHPFDIREEAKTATIVRGKTTKLAAQRASA